MYVGAQQAGVCCRSGETGPGLERSREREGETEREREREQRASG